MSTMHRTNAFTLIELLVVLAIISLLTGILIPSLSRAREQSKSAVCLSNLRQIGALLHAYSDEDRTNQPVPIHRMMTQPTGLHWLWHTANSFVWGGRDAQRPLLHNVPGFVGELWLSGGSAGYCPPDMAVPAYGAAGRPLNRYYLGAGLTASDCRDLPLFRCPSDMGYPAEWPAVDVPSCAAGVPCYDLFGNSYRANMCAFVDDTGALSVSPWGHRMHTLPDTGKLVLLAEAPFFSLSSGLCEIQNRIDWHGRDRTANILFVDGSARATTTRRNPPLDEDAADEMGLLPGCNPSLIHRGPSWRLDTWPTPGARIWGYEAGWTRTFPAVLDPFPLCRWKRDTWPFQSYQRNLE